MNSSKHNRRRSIDWLWAGLVHQTDSVAKALCAQQNNVPDRAPVLLLVNRDDRSDFELVRRARAGDTGSLEALFRRYYRAAYALALAQTSRREDAEDVCHDAFLRAADRLHTCKDPGRFRYWLCSIVRNVAHNSRDRERVRHTQTLAPEMAQAPDNPLRFVELAELRQNLESALSLLPPVQRAVVLLHDLDGWTHETIAELLDVSVVASRQQLFQARRRLRQTLATYTSPESSP